jgi:hypothetical protein
MPGFDPSEIQRLNDIARRKATSEDEGCAFDAGETRDARRDAEGALRQRCEVIEISSFQPRAGRRKAAVSEKGRA